MKKYLLMLLALVMVAQQNVAAWGKYGHQIVIAVAQRHISETTKANIAKYFDYDLKDDAVWMDTHRNDPEIAYTTAWHVYNVNEKHEYDPNPRLSKEDAIYAMYLADYNLSHYQELTDSAVVMNVRVLIHFAGDMHCPVHSYIPGPRNFWECTLGDYKGTFHSVYDKIPGWLYTGKPDDVAAQLDNASKREIRRIQKGTVIDWAKQCADRNAGIYEINPFLTEVLDPDTVEKSRDIVSLQLRDAGYRLAYLLNKYFGNK
ncbi:MAG: S1/P1 nuclease [Bacteroidales bacterium]|nr:S1/P1 nuclease [Bacteroidales bacterium]